MSDVTFVDQTTVITADWLNDANTHVNNKTTGLHTAANITNTPAGDIASTSVQGAINELDTEKANLASPTFTGTPAAPTAAVGTNTTQVATTAFTIAEIPNQIHAATSKATPVDADELPLIDSAASNALKKLTWSNLKATAKTYFDTLYQTLAAKDASGGYAGLTLLKINFLNVAGTFTSYFTNTNTASRTYTFQDKTGTIAHLEGVTDGSSASAGQIGEEITSTVLQASAVALTTATSKDVTSISLTAGDWEVSGSVFNIPAATTSITVLQGGISTTTNTFPVASAGSFIHRTAALVPTAVVWGYDISPIRISVSGTTTVYLEAMSTFTVSTNAAFGTIRARRMR